MADTGQQFCTSETKTSDEDSKGSIPISEDSSIAVSLRIFFVVFAYWFVSITLVFLNKYLLGSRDLKFDAPLFVTWYQCAVSVFVCALLGVASKLFSDHVTFQIFSINFQGFREILPLSILFLTMIFFNNLCLKHVGISFYFVGRSLTTVFNVVLSYFILKHETSSKEIVCCAIIICGFSVGVNQEGVLGSLELGGVFYGVMSSVAIALYCIFIKKKLPAVDDNVWRLTLYNNLNAFFLFVPFIIAFETNSIMSFPNLTSGIFWSIMTVGGVFGFTISYISGLQVHYTSPLTHIISGTAKSCVQTVLATVYFKEIKTVSWWFGNILVLSGSAAYAIIRQQMARQS